jgi:hypothetical protein
MRLSPAESSMFSAVFVILAWSPPPKVAKTAVSADPVQMATLVASWTRTNKSIKHKLVHCIRRYLVATASETNFQVSLRAYAALAKPFRLRAPMVTGPVCASLSTYSSLVGNLIKFFVPDNGLPCLYAGRHRLRSQVVTLQGRQPAGAPQCYSKRLSER